MILLILANLFIGKVPGKPWVLCEALQALLKANIEKLIEMGFNSRLKVR